ncbi:thioredoxin family protein [Sphingobacterium deserti]|uniref:Thioredoxin-like subdomain protein n=1 Tax=Sphingobacterium deserti TaxID=1229276 RepID=A0A0B8T203_9SPHI|nr:thioredoxin family protein [Sphingobacterium deserti]KGE15182.1 thioredoxin-like subdomain protein [Sphingobacterium deserti]
MSIQHNHRYSKSLFAGLCLLLSSLSAMAQPKESIQWISFEQLADSLRTKPKRVLLFFHTDWCAYCRKMQNDVFTDPQLVKRINNDYYAVRFDAESVDSVHFEGQIFTNEVTKKRTGRYHALARILAARDGKFVFPATLFLEPDFTVRHRHFEYLDRNRVLKLL